MSRNSKNANKAAVAKQITQMHKNGQRGPGKTAAVHGKKKRLPFKNAGGQQAVTQQKQRRNEEEQDIVAV
jgi:hypothetical protein